LPDFNLHDYFTSDQIKPHASIWRWDLNKTPKSPVKRILLMAQLIQHCQDEDYVIQVKPDNRLRAKGLCVVFANKTNVPD
jgi:hypothetical protein